MANLFQTIATNIRSALPRSVKAFELYAHVYPQYSFSAISALHQNEQRVTADVLSDSVLDETLDLLQQLKQNDLLQGKVWTQCKISVDADAGVTFEFAHIPLEHSHPHLFMQGIEVLAAQDLDAYDVDEDEWLAVKDMNLQAAVMAPVSVACTPQSQFAVAIDYAIGRNGIAQNTERAYEYFERLLNCEATSLAAYYNWAAMWDLNPQYVEESQIDVRTMQARAKKFDPAAQFVLGLMYQSGYQGLAANIEHAKQCYSKAAEHGFIPAQLRLDDLCVDSAGLAQD
ncbi:SEL1-like repeat protein [Vitreoscilla massiliensis]|uniref:SEL1-like repeat protein n=1 Tax=Vitreoscilla massiliensis TaxID=1689272 RepID=A0ABY4DZ54_9NEIS|nr:SEL1-like repeat protein [Vitreoscilla massiliensis]UOO88279.1 SEL1-like repeat protein [Vitreoscilla massiliensis]